MEQNTKKTKPGITLELFKKLINLKTEEDLKGYIKKIINIQVYDLEDGEEFDFLEKYQEAIIWGLHSIQAQADHKAAINQLLSLYGYIYSSNNRKSLTGEKLAFFFMDKIDMVQTYFYLSDEESLTFYNVMNGAKQAMELYQRINFFYLDNLNYKRLNQYRQGIAEVEELLHYIFNNGNYQREEIDILEDMKENAALLKQAKKAKADKDNFLFKGELWILIEKIRRNGEIILPPIIEDDLSYNFYDNRPTLEDTTILFLMNYRDKI